MSEELSDRDRLGLDRRQSIRRHAERNRSDRRALSNSRVWPVRQGITEVKTGPGTWEHVYTVFGITDGTVTVDVKDYASAVQGAYIHNLINGHV